MKPSDLPQPKPYRVGGYWAPLAFLDLTLDTSSSMTHSTPSPCLRHSGCWTAHMLLCLWLKVSSNLILSLYLLKHWSLFKVKPKYVSTSSPCFLVAVVSPFGVFPSLYIWFLWGSGNLLITVISTALKRILCAWWVLSNACCIILYWNLLIYYQGGSWIRKRYKRNEISSKWAVSSFPLFNN